MPKAVIGLASDLKQTERTVEKLRLAGFLSDEISILMPDMTSSAEFAYENQTKAPEGTVVGAASGAAVGGVLGWLAGMGLLMVPGIGYLMAAGPIVAALSGAAAGGAVGGVTGALIGMGVPEYEAKIYEGRVKEGNVLIAVHAADKELTQRAEAVLRECGVHDVFSVDVQHKAG